MKTHAFKLFITLFLQCEGSSWLRQPDYKSMETFNNPIGVSKNVVLPSVVDDLPRARDILPGHTLIRPDMDSLRSAIRYPNKELEDGARVYGNIKSVGVSIGNNERIINTGFRRSRDYDEDKNGGDVASGRKYKAGDGDSSDENYLNFKNGVVLKPRQNFFVYSPSENCQSDGYGDTAACSLQKKPTQNPGKQTKIYALGGLMVVKNEAAMRSRFLNARKNNYGASESRNINKKLVPVHSNYVIILANDESAKKQKEIKFDESNEDDDKKTLNSNRIREFSNARVQPLIKTKSVLRAGKSKPVPVLINPQSRANVEKESYIAPQKLLDYLNTRNEFDHVKISDSAPTIEQLVPISPSGDNNIRKWWFYNQDDYKPFLN